MVPTKYIWKPFGRNAQAHLPHNIGASAVMTSDNRCAWGPSRKGPLEATSQHSHLVLHPPCAWCCTWAEGLTKENWRMTWPMSFPISQFKTLAIYPLSKQLFANQHIFLKVLAWENCILFRSFQSSHRQEWPCNSPETPKGPTTRGGYFNCITWQWIKNISNFCYFTYLDFYL